MARTNVPITEALANGAVTITPTTLDPTNGHNVPAAGKSRKMVLRINNTTVSSKIVTVKAGVYPPAFRQQLGDLALTIPASTVQLVQVESARFLQSDGSINIDVAAGMTGAIEALRAGPGNA